MNFAGNPLLSKVTIISGRSLFLVSLAIILAHRYEIDLSTLRALDISLTEDQLNPTMIWVLVILWITHVVHWVGDFVSLGKWNSSMSAKLTESIIGSGAKSKGRLELIIENFEKAINPNDKRTSVVNIDFVKKELQELQDSFWWHQKTAVFYVVGWYLIVPTGLMAYATYLVIYA